MADFSRFGRMRGFAALLLPGQRQLLARAIDAERYFQLCQAIGIPADRAAEILREEYARLMGSPGDWDPVQAARERVTLDAGSGQEPTHA